MDLSNMIAQTLSNISLFWLLSSNTHILGMLHLFERILCQHIHMGSNNGKRDYEFERDQGGVHGKAWKGGNGGGNDVIIL